MRPYPIGNGILTPRVPPDFAALMDALQMEGANTDALLLLEEEEWQKLLEFSDLAHLSLPLALVNQTGFPAWVKSRLDENLADNAKRFELVQKSYIEAAAALSRAGVSHVVLKGFTQAPDFVASPSLRMQSDIDLYCPPDQIDKAHAALVSIGYRPVVGPDYGRADHVPTLTRRGNWKWRGNMFDPEMPLAIELHFTLWNDSATLIRVPDVDRFWSRRIVRRIGNLGFCALNPIDQLGYFALHIVRDAISGDWVVHHVHELARFLHIHAANVEFWDEWLASHNAKMRSLQCLAFVLAKYWFSCACSSVVCAEIERLPAVQRQWLQLYGGSPLEIMFRRNKDGNLLRVLLADTPRTRRVALRRALLPTRIVGPTASDVSLRYRRSTATEHANLRLQYVRFLLRKLIDNAFANTAFLFHICLLWLSNRSVRARQWIFLGHVPSS